MRIRQTNSTNRRCRRAALGPSNMHVAQLSGAVHWSLSQHRPCLVAAYPYLEVASGSIPLFLIASEARAEARNSISRLEPSMSPEPATTAAENVWTNWISGARLPAKSTPAACTISLTGMTTRSALPAATMPVASLPRGVALTLIFSAMPSRGKRSFVSQIPLVLPGIATVLALSRTCLKASTVLTSGFGAPARTATPRATRARSTSVPATILLAAISSLRPSLERITTLAGTPRASCAAIVCGPVPCDAPDPVVTLMPLVRSNSGNSCSYAPLNPPDIKTFNCADAAIGQSSVAKMTNEKIFMIDSSPARSRTSDETITHYARRGRCTVDLDLALCPDMSRSGHPRSERSKPHHSACPLRLSKRTGAPDLSMSALCQSRSSAPQLHGESLPAPTPHTRDENLRSRSCLNYAELGSRIFGQNNAATP